MMSLLNTRTSKYRLGRHGHTQTHSHRAFAAIMPRPRWMCSDGLVPPGADRVVRFAHAVISPTAMPCLHATHDALGALLPDRNVEFLSELQFHSPGSLPQVLEMDFT